LPTWRNAQHEQQLWPARAGSDAARGLLGGSGSGKTNRGTLACRTVLERPSGLFFSIAGDLCRLCGSGGSGTQEDRVRHRARRARLRGRSISPFHPPTMVKAARYAGLWCRPGMQTLPTTDPEHRPGGRFGLARMMGYTVSRTIKQASSPASGCYAAARKSHQ